MRRADSSPAPRPAAALRPWGAACFFVSGAAGLLYEVVWSKQLTYVLGSSLHATAAVVAAFLGGLALGARALGVPLARRGSGARTYALLELGVGLLGLALLPALRSLDPVVGAMYRGLGPGSPQFAVARMGLLFLLLIPPAALMGATLPVLVGHFERSRVGVALAALYAINTFGAVVGSVAGGFILLPRLGLSRTTFVAAGLNLAAAAVAWGFGSRAPREARSAARAAAATRAGSGPMSAPLAGAAYATLASMFALSGFAALAFQIAWVRLFGLALGSSVYSFSAVLGVYLLGLGAGSALAIPWLRGRVTLAGYALLLCGLAAAGAVGMHAFARLPRQVLELGRAIGPHWTPTFLAELLLVAQVVLVPCVLLGAAFPVATHLLQRKDGGHAAGFAYALNTFGTIVGALVAGFYLLPEFGVQATHLLAVALFAALALGAVALALARRELRPLHALLATALLAIGGAAVATAPPWNPILMSLGTYRPFYARGITKTLQDDGAADRDAVRHFADTQRLLYYRDGINASVLVASSADGTRRSLRVGGKVDASTGDMKTQVLLGLIPGALADSGARALVIGLGSGVTAASALAAGAGRTDIVELERGVIEGSRFFHEQGRGPLDDPRVRVYMEDARTHVADSGERYGLIISEPSNPWIAGVNNLFTVDFYRSVRKALTPDGVFCQWMQLYELSPETLGSMIRSFAEVFPDAQLFCVWRSNDLLVVATPPQRRLSLARASSPEARAALAVARMVGPEQIASYYAGPIGTLESLTDDAPLNLDDRPIVEYLAPRDLVQVALGRLGIVLAARRGVSYVTAPPPGALFSAWTAAAWAEWRASEELNLADPASVPVVLARLHAAGLGDMADRLGAELAAARNRQRADADLARARQLAGRGDWRQAADLLAALVHDQPLQPDAWVALAEARYALGDVAGAATAAAVAAGSSDPAVRARAASVLGHATSARAAPAAAARSAGR